MEFSTVLVYVKQLLATLMMLLMMLSPAFGGEGAPYEARNKDELVMSFAAVSDTHVETNNPEAYKAFYNLLEGVKAGKDIDATVFLGDNVMNGQVLEDLFFYLGVRGVKPSDNIFVALGNHDIGNGEGDYNKLNTKFLFNNGFYLKNKLDKPYYYRVVNGCYMIFLASEELTVDTCIMSEEQLSWLQGVLDEAAENKAPAFVFNHHPLYYLEGVESDSLAKLIAEYKNVLYINGHIHDELGEDNFINENGVNTISLPRATEVVDYEPGDGIVVEVYENEILVRGRNFVTGEFIEGIEYSYELTK